MWYNLGGKDSFGVDTTMYGIRSRYWGGLCALRRADRAVRRLTRDCRPPYAVRASRTRARPVTCASKTQIMETHLLAKTLLKLRSLYKTNTL